MELIDFRLDDRGSIPGSGRKSIFIFFSLPPRPDRLWSPPILIFKGYRGFVLGVKRPGREADHSPPSSSEVKNGWNYVSTPQYVFMA